jgi:hypothetical protein
MLNIKDNDLYQWLKRANKKNTIGMDRLCSFLKIKQQGNSKITELFRYLNKTNEK